LGLDAVEYWMGELANRSEGTRNKYMEYFSKFCEWAGKTANELVEQRKEDLKSDDPREQRRVESKLKGFMAHLENEGMSVATRQVAYAAVRSFFEMHFQPLRMRRGDYPTGESLGSRVATKDDLKQICEDAPLRIRALILFLKDTGLRVSDVRRLTYGDVAEGLENNEEFIPLQLITKKNKITAKTFLGPEAIEALKEYFKERREGTRRIPPETITSKSPLFRTRENEVKPITRSGLSSIVTFYASKHGINSGFSAHSFRKYFQTALEASGINTNWIDQMIGHRMINSRDAYSRPTCEQLKESYIKAYPNLRVFKDSNFERRVENLETQIEERDKLIESLVSNGTNKNKEIEQLQDQIQSLEKRLEALSKVKSKSDVVAEAIMQDPRFQQLIFEKLSEGPIEVRENIKENKKTEVKIHKLKKKDLE
jgi:integrase/recombinase XerD